MKLNVISKTFLISLLVFLSACTDNPVSSVFHAVTTNSLTGKINNYRKEADIVQTIIYGDSSYMFMGTDTVGTDAMLNLTLKTPSDDWLRPVSDLAILGEQLFVSDQSARGTNFLNIRMFGTGFVNGSLLRRNAPVPIEDFVGLTNVSYVYADRQVYIIGVITDIHSDTLVYDVDLSMAKGWNIVSFELTVLRDHYRQLSIHAGEPSDSQWYFYQF